MSDFYIPQTGAPVAFSDTLPSSEAVTPAVGSMSLASRGDHAHARLTSVTIGTTAADATATVTFTRTFAQQPGLVLQANSYGASNQPVQWDVIAFVMTGPLYTGVTLKAFRSQTIPTNLATLLLGGVFNLFAGSAANVQFSCIAIQASS